MVFTRRTALLISVISLAILLLAACGRNRPPVEEAQYNRGQTGNIGTDSYASLLTIAAPAHYTDILRDAGERLNAELQESGAGVSIELILYTPEELPYHVQGQQALFSAGQGADIFFVTPQHNILAFIEDGLLADINGLIAAYASRDYFFTTVLEALEIDGQLFTFPLNFAFEYVGINSNLPVEFVEHFATYDAITFDRLFALYNDLQNAHPEWGHLAVGMGAVSRFNLGFHGWVSDSINWVDKTVSFPGLPLIQFLNRARLALEDNNRHNTIAELGGVFGNPTFANVLALQQERYVFSFTTQALDTANALLNFHNSPFVNYIPLAGEDGGLFLPQATTSLFGVNANSNGELALAYLRHLTAAWVDSTQGQLSLATPIERALFLEHAENGFQHAMLEPQAQQGGGRIPEAIARLEHYLSLPVSVSKVRFMLPPDLYIHYVSNFLAGEMAPVGLIQEIEHNISYWMETGAIFEIDPAILEAKAAQEARAQLPVRTLYIHANHNFCHSLAQAAEAMNQEWASRGKPYNFDIYITTYRLYPRYESNAELIRLSTLLMAGQGYDMFLVNFYTEPWPLWAWAQSGLLTDIWTLMDACQNTGRSHFYENVLESFTHNGGLWAFPIGFSFEYVGINANLPQRFIDRFASYSTISLGQMMAVYEDLMTYYGDEFNHLSLSSGANTGLAAEAVIRSITSFIDFGNRTSNLDSDGFIEFMRLVGQSYTAMTRHPMAEIYMKLDSPYRVSDKSRYFVFSAYSWSLNPARALLPLNEYYFIHKIPLTDEVGRLRISHRGGSQWGAWSFPAAGDSELAWEFTQHLTYAMVNPVGIALRHPYFHVIESLAGGNRAVTPINRSMLENQTYQWIIAATEWDQLAFGRAIFAPHLYTPEGRARELENVLARLSVYNEMPISLPPLIPHGLRQGIIDTVEQLIHGIITPETAAQHIHNRVFLWLIE